MGFGLKRMVAIFLATLIISGVSSGEEIKWALTLLQENRFDEAKLALMSVAEKNAQHIEELTRKVKQNPLGPEGHLLLGLGFFGGKKYDEAYEHISLAAKLIPPQKKGFIFSRGVNLMLGEVSMAQKRYAQALEFFMKAGDTKSAENACRFSLRIEPGKATLHRHLGIILTAEERFAEAAEEFRKGLGADPEDTVALRNLSIVLIELGHYGQATEYARRLVQFVPDSPEAHFTLGMAYEESGDLDRALKEYEAALSVYPGHKDAKAAISRLREKKWTGWIIPGGCGVILGLLVFLHLRRRRLAAVRGQ